MSTHRAEVAQVAFARTYFVLLFFSILTLWVDSYWPVAVFLTGTFLLTAAKLATISDPSVFNNRLIILLLGLLPAWVLFQWLSGSTVYAEPTRTAALAILLYPCVVFLVSGLPARFADQCRTGMLFFAFVVAVIAMLQNASGAKVFWLFKPAYTNFVMGPILYHNHWAAFVEAVLPIAVYYALSSPRRPWLYSVVAASLYASVIASASRSGALVTTAELLIVPLIMARKRRLPASTARFLIPIVGVILLFTIIVGTKPLLDRLQSSDPYLVRREVIKPSIAMIADHLWMGVGAGNWPIVYPSYAYIDFGVFVNQAHNDWLQWFAEGGILYGAVFAALAIVACKQAWHFPWALGVAAVLVQALMDYPFSRPALAAWTLSVLALSTNSGRNTIDR